MAVLDDGRCMDNRVKQVDGLIKSTIGSFGGVTRRRKEDAEASSYVIQHISSARPSCPLQDFSLPTADWLSSLFALPSLHGFIWTCRLSLSLSLSLSPSLPLSSRKSSISDTVRIDDRTLHHRRGSSIVLDVSFTWIRLLFPALLRSEDLWHGRNGNGR